MAFALYSGGDTASNAASSASSIAAYVFAGSNQNGSIGPGAGTKMSFLGRYIGNGHGGGGANGGIAIGASELSSLRSAGLDVFFFYESNLILPQIYPNAWYNQTTFTQGSLDAIDAQNYLSSVLGISTANMPVYFAVDYNCMATSINQGSTSISALDQEIALSNYFQGINSVMGGNTGCYGNGTLWGLVGQSVSPYAFWYCQSDSYTYSGNGNYVSGQNLWQWPPGYSPAGGPRTIGSISVDGEFAYTTDFGQYPRPGTTSGILTAGVATITPPVFTQPTVNTIIVPDNKYDQILWSRTGGTISVPNTPGSYSYTIATTGINQAGYPIGNFSYDSGNSYVDFGFLPSGDFYGQFYNLPVMIIQATVTPAGVLSFNVVVESVFPPGGADLTIIYNVAVMAAYNAVKVPHGSGETGVVSQAIGYSNINVSPGAASTYAIYRRINADFADTTSGSTTYAHGLNEVPNILFWTEGASALLGTTLINSIHWTSTGPYTTPVAALGIAMDDTNIYFYLDSGLTAIYCRIYKDN